MFAVTTPHSLHILLLLHCNPQAHIRDGNLHIFVDPGHLIYADIGPKLQLLLRCGHKIPIRHQFLNQSYILQPTLSLLPLRCNIPLPIDHPLQRQPLQKLNLSIKSRARSPPYPYELTHQIQTQYLEICRLTTNCNIKIQSFQHSHTITRQQGLKIGHQWFFFWWCIFR